MPRGHLGSVVEGTDGVSSMDAFMFTLLPLGSYEQLM